MSSTAPGPETAGPPLAPLPELVVVGCPSLDVVNLPSGTRPVVGGAAFLTALAARRAGLRVGLVARVPARLPAEIAAAFGPDALAAEGLVVDPAGLPAFEIDYDTAGRATYRAATPGAEGALTAADFPDAWLGVPGVHVASLAGRTERTHAFVRGLRARGYGGRISAGTYLAAAHDEPEAVRALVADVDVFFCNREEAECVFGTPRAAFTALLCITDGANPLEVHWPGTLDARGGLVDPGARGIVERRPVPEVEAVED